ncbi:MAG: DMT family transporter [Deltaproteobacteria bacterium]|nr:DMT family transporter [Deltaproteobacteria bacterium]
MKADPRSGTHNASLVALAATGFFATMGMVARLLSRSFPGTQIAMVRFAVGVVVVLLLLPILRSGLRPQRWGWLLSRGVFGSTAALLYFVSIEKIGVGIATLLNNTSPVWSMLFAWLLLRERPHKQTAAAVAMTVVGVALVASGQGHGWRLGGWELLATLSAVLAGMAITSVRATRRESADGTEGESSWTVFASFTVLGLLATLPTVLPPYGTWIEPNAQQWLLLVVCGLLSVGGQVLMTSSLGKLTAVSLGITQQTTVVLAMAGGIFFFGEPLSPRGAIGSVITVSGVLWSMRAETTRG